MIPISVCIITKNEEKHMEEFLSRIRSYHWEIIVVDTGSTDQTRNIAEKYADKVADFVWVNDFSAARNFSISLASHDYVLILDCDEYVTSIDFEKISSLIEENPDSVGCIERHNFFESNETRTDAIDHVERLFHKDYYSYKYPIHEQVVNPEETAYSYFMIPLVVEHFGYLISEEDKVAKAERNNDILFKVLEEEPDNAYVLFQIGQSYFMLDDYESAYPYYRKSLLLEANPNLGYVNMLVTSYGHCLLHTDRLEEAMQLLQVYDYYCQYSDFCCLAGNIYLKNNYPVKAMAEFVKATVCEHFYIADAKFNIPMHNIAYIYELLGDIDSALKYYKQCDNYPNAQKRIAELENQTS